MKISLKELVFGRIPVAIAADLKARPEGWRQDLSRLVRSEGDIHIWCGNSQYGVAVYKGFCSASEMLVWGGVSLLSTFYLDPGHLYLWRAVKRWKREPAERVLKRAARAAILEAVAQ